MITPLFSLPAYTYSIDEKLYDKKNIINVIENNYKKNKTRNKWEADDDIVSSNLHHNYNDSENTKFEKPNYTTIIPVYQKIISNLFLNDLKLKKDIVYNFEIVNYTCMTGSQYMKSHYHNDCDFTGVHYIKFNPKVHKPTLYENTHNFSRFVRDLRPKLNDVLDDNYCLNSWYSKNYFLNTKENDFVITPSFLFHSVPYQPSTKETRITIVLNIKLE
jgi:hypothetical protein